MGSDARPWNSAYTAEFIAPQLPQSWQVPAPPQHVTEGGATSLSQLPPTWFPQTSGAPKHPPAQATGAQLQGQHQHLQQQQPAGFQAAGLQTPQPQVAGDSNHADAPWLPDGKYIIRSASHLTDQMGTCLTRGDPGRLKNSDELPVNCRPLDEEGLHAGQKLRQVWQLSRAGGVHDNLFTLQSLHPGKNGKSFLGAQTPAKQAGTTSDCVQMHWEVGSEGMEVWSLHYQATRKCWQLRSCVRLQTGQPSMLCAPDHGRTTYLSDDTSRMRADWQMDLMHEVMQELAQKHNEARTSAALEAAKPRPSKRPS